ncbi:amino acid ABC transporter permease [Mesorhizobium sp. 2RAF21]|uniref:amino acid ABC transporter permease n=1 Tax=Mesorhizobium sp. 2RAF21 TaxID=3232995 RepID=UPI003F9EA8BB
MFDNFLSNALDWLPLLLRGTAVTLVATVATMILATIWGTILGLIRHRKVPVISRLVVIYVEIFRGMPTIVILFILYYGLPTVGLTISREPLVVGIIGLTLGLGAYISEVVRAAINAIDPGQLEASRSLGLSDFKAYCLIILPQALLVAIPSLGSFFVGLIKDTSLLSFISISDLLKTGNDIVSATFLSFQVYALIGAIYILLSMFASRMLIILERTLTPIELRAA